MSLKFFQSIDVEIERKDSLDQYTTHTCTLRKARKRIADALGRVKQAVSHRRVLNRDIWAGRHSH